MIRLPNKTIERRLIAQGIEYIIGIDEVGMACLAGPVTACAIAIHRDFYKKRDPSFSWLRDSKTLTPAKREEFAAKLSMNPHIRYFISSEDNLSIDRHNIFRASQRAMRNALKQLNIPAKKAHILIDGNKNLAGVAYNQDAIVKGDRHIFSIAAASILAKVHRDELMTRLSSIYPEYGLSIHKGYPTLRHREALLRHGPCTIHRRSFLTKILK